MKFQLKALATALAFAVITLPAQASIDETITGNGSLVLTVLDRVANISAAFDLGKNYSDFNISGTDFANSGVTASGTTFSWDLANNADYTTAWSTFLASATLPNIQYAITAGDNLGTGTGHTGYVTTYKSNGTSLTTSGLITAIGNFDTYTKNQLAGSANGIPYENHSTVANGGSVAVSGAGYGAAFYFPSGKGSNTGPVIMGAIGTDLGVAQTVGGASSFASATQTIFGNGAKFNLASNGALIYSTTPIVASVPEADTWAMMLLGLGFMGFVARRKQA